MQVLREEGKEGRKERERDRQRLGGCTSAVSSYRVRVRNFRNKLRLSQTRSNQVWRGGLEGEVGYFG